MTDAQDSDPRTTVTAAQIAYYRAEADDLELRARAYPTKDKLHGAILRRRDAALALAAALEAQGREGLTL